MRGWTEASVLYDSRDTLGAVGVRSVDDGINLVKFWFSVSREEQMRRFNSRRSDPLKHWKLSPIDLAARDRYAAYTKAREAMLRATHTEHAPWTLVDFNDQRRGRLTLVRDLLSRVPDTHEEPETIDFPELGRKLAKEKYKVLKPIPGWEG